MLKSERSAAESTLIRVHGAPVCLAPGRLVVAQRDWP